MTKLDEAVEIAKLHAGIIDTLGHSPNHTLGPLDVQRVCSALLAAHARLVKLERVAEKARELRGHESTWCLVTPPCGGCMACNFNEAIAALGDEK